MPSRSPRSFTMLEPADEQQPGTLLKKRLSRRSVLGVLGAACLLPLVAACGGGNDDETTPTAGADGTGTPEDDSPVVMATFTPAPPTATAGASPTSSGSPTAAATIAPDSTQAPGEPTPTQAPNEIRAPLVWLGTAAGDNSVEAWVSEFTWYDEELQSVGGRMAPPYSEMPPTRLQAGADDTLEVRVAASPYPIRDARIELFPWEGNVALPQDPTGRVLSDVPVFVRQTEPLFSETISGAEPLQTQPGLPAGTYIATVRVEWTLPEDLAAAVGRPVFAVGVVAMDLS